MNSLQHKHRDAGFKFRVFVGASLLAISGSQAAAESYETETVLFDASQMLDEALLIGPNHTVDGTVVNQGYLNHYQIETPFGAFTVSGDAQVPEMIQEINAIAALQQMSRTGVLAQSALDAVQQPVDTVRNIATNPAETVRGIPAGLGRLFSRSKDIARDVSTQVAEVANNDDSEVSSLSTDEVTQAGTDLAMNFIGVGSAQRELASELKVDPYSSNAVLQSELAELATYAAAGSFGANLVMPSIPGLGVVSNVNDLVWSMSSRDLKLLNQKTLTEMGVAEADVERFFANAFYTPTDQTRLVSWLEALTDVDGRAAIVNKAATATSRDEALLYVRMTSMLAAYHTTRAPIANIVPTDRILQLATTQDGTMLLPVPVDYINWRESTAEAASEFMNLSSVRGGTSGGEIWIEGRASDQARRELTSLGWSVFEHAFDQLAPADQGTSE
jgi:hypothetical protein